MWYSAHAGPLHSTAGTARLRQDNILESAGQQAQGLQQAAGASCCLQETACRTQLAEQHLLSTWSQRHSADIAMLWSGQNMAQQQPQQAAMFSSSKSGALSSALTKFHASSYAVMMSS
jgi:hypothetical protein